MMRTPLMRLRSRLGRAAAVTVGMAGVFACLPAPSPASTPGPQWTVTAVSAPTNFAPGDESGQDAYLVTVKNTGGSATDGSPITITDELPLGLTLASAGASAEDQLAGSSEHISCALRSCTYTGVLAADDTLTATIPVDVSLTTPTSVTNVVRVTGGGGADAAVHTPTAISSSPAPFGISPGGASTALSSNQAGAHPDLTTSIAFNTVDRTGSLAGDPKNTSDDLPPGFAGDLIDTPSCSAARFTLRECPAGSQVGVITLTLSLNHKPRGVSIRPVYNLAPNPGEVAKLGFYALSVVAVEGDVSLRGSDYGLRATFHNVDEGPVELENLSLTIWGVPEQSNHDPLRWKSEGGSAGSFGSSSDTPPAPFFTNPTSCSGVPLSANFTVTAWQASAAPVEEAMQLGPIVGCDKLTMQPTVNVVPTTINASAATGLNLEMDIPQTYNNADGLATSHLKRVVVTLPSGMTVNPSSGAGLAACTQAEYEEEGVQAVPGQGCPANAKLGTVTAQSPALSESATGTVYIATPYDNPFHSLLALYIVARIPNRGVVVKTAGEVAADPVTGQLVTTFDNLPPLPFGTFTFSFRQGATSPLVTPPLCGSYPVQSQLAPWANPAEILQPTITPFEIAASFNGGPCPGIIPPFAPSVTAGTLDNRAAAYSPLNLRISRVDGEQEITRFSSQLPPGLTANLSGVPFCPDADIARAASASGAQEEAEPACPLASQIGHTLVGAGVGSVLAWTPGRLYLAGPYNGAPFSIVAVTSAKVGPFDLGTVVVREALKIDPQTAIVTVDASASDPIPHIIKGIVIHVRDIRVYVDRPAFTLNPTNCERMALAATVTGSGADVASLADDVPVTVTDPFQMADCQALAFKPLFTASASGKTSKRDGASLKVKLTYTRAPQGSQANIRFVKVDLPIQLPSRLTTLQKACRDTTFDVNPANCPAGAIVGHATAVTPILPVPLVGPAYFVSHGGAKFPELIIVLQGYGVMIELHGETFISKAGVTSSTFRSVPDQPVSSFELTLPQGPDSALAANGDLCAVHTATTLKTVVLRRHGRTRRVRRRLTRSVAPTLQMPTTFIAQNGSVIHQSTPITITGCAKPRAAGKGPHGAHRRKGARGSKS